MGERKKKEKRKKRKQKEGALGERKEKKERKERKKGVSGNIRKHKKKKERVGCLQVVGNSCEVVSRMWVSGKKPLCRHVRVSGSNDDLWYPRSCEKTCLSFRGNK